MSRVGSDHGSVRAGLALVDRENVNINIDIDVDIGIDRKVEPILVNLRGFQGDVVCRQRLEVNVEINELGFVIERSA